jgi:hypothetical protein
MNNPKRVLFTSPFGTGKTFLMKEKAKEVLKQRKAWKKSGKKLLNSSNNFRTITTDSFLNVNLSKKPF